MRYKTNIFPLIAYFPSTHPFPSYQKRFWLISRASTIIFKMPSLLTLAVGLAALNSVASAIPTVTPVLLTGGCASYPSYDASTLVAGPWILQLNSCDNSTIEGFGDNSQLIRRAGDTWIHEGRISIVADNQIAKNALRCNAATEILEGYFPQGVSGYAWQQVNITDIPYDAELGWGWGQYSTGVQAYEHFIDGVQQDGVFLGQDGYTTWGVKWYADGDDNEDYWGLRLLGANSAVPGTNGTALLDGEYRTFLKIAA